MTGVEHGLPPRPRSGLPFGSRLPLGLLLGAWTPTLIALLALGILGAAVAGGATPAFLAKAVRVYMLALLVLLVSVIASFWMQQWRKALLKLAFWILLLPINPLISRLFVAAVTRPAPDTFSQGLTIPPGLDVANPIILLIGPFAAADPESMELAAAFESNGPAAPLLDADTTWLDGVTGTVRDLVFRHLATSARWRVTEERGHVYAVRRALLGGRWIAASDGLQALAPDTNGPGPVQYRIVIGRDGPALADPWRTTGRATYVMAGEGPISLRTMKAEQDGALIDSYLVVISDGPAIELYEQSPREARTLTAVALRQVEGELHAVINSRAAAERGFDPALLPDRSISRAGPELVLINGRPAGSYLVDGWVNPGEPGYVYLKAFEATRGTELSAQRLREASLEYTGWSADPEEKFFFGGNVTIYEGEPGRYYAARFEVWFVPASGAPERKLMEQIYRIEGSKS